MLMLSTPCALKQPLDLNSLIIDTIYVYFKLWFVYSDRHEIRLQSNAVFVRKRKKNRNFFKTYSLKCVAQKITPYEIY